MKRNKKIAILAAMSAALLTGCDVDVEPTKNSETTTTTTTTTSNIEEIESLEITEEELKEILEELKPKKNTDVKVNENLTVDMDTDGAFKVNIDGTNIKIYDAEPVKETTMPVETTISIPSTTTTSISTPTTTTSVSVETTISSKNYDENDIVELSKLFLDSYDNLYDIRVVNELTATIGEGFNTLYSISRVYHPSDVSVLDFVDVIKKYNNLTSDTIYPNDKIKIPVTALIYQGVDPIKSVLSSVGGSPRFNDFNNITEEQNETINKYGTYKSVILNVLPQNTKSYTGSDNKKYNICGKSVFEAENFIECGRTYDEYAIASGYGYDKNSDGGVNGMFYQFYDDGSYTYYYMGRNIMDMTLVNGVPVFKTRSMDECHQLESTSDYVYQYYCTVLKSHNVDKIYFYKDLSGNMCFTFDPTDLTKYGYTRADEFDKLYFRGERFFAQDETGISLNKKDYTKEDEEYLTNYDLQYNEIKEKQKKFIR